MKNLLVQTKFYWSWARGPVLIMRTVKCSPFLLTSLHSSTKIKNRSNLDMMGAVRDMFCFSDFVLSYLLPMGLAAANTEVLAFKVA